MEWQERIRYFTLDDYNTLTEPMPYGFTTEEGTSLRIVKKVAIYAFNPKWNTLPNIIVGKYVEIPKPKFGPADSETDRLFDDYSKD